MAASPLPVTGAHALPKTVALARSLFFLFALTLTVLASSEGPASGHPPFRERIRELGQTAERASTTESYAAMRELWSAWDQGDPVVVESELERLARVKSGTTSVYARVLSAYARRRRGDLAGAERTIDALGFVRNWLTVGPFNNEGKAGFIEPFGPETTTKPPDGTEAFAGKERPVRFRRSPAKAPYGWLDFGDLVRPEQNVCAFAETFVLAKKKDAPASDATIWIGSAGAIKVFFNGKEILADDKYRALDVDRMGARVRVERGPNRLLVKACGESSAPIFALRIADSNGAPTDRFEAHADPALDEQARKAASTGRRGALLGPLPALEARAKSGSAADKYAYARYLVLTHSDDPAEHAARDFATRAAEQAPTVDRLLLAAELAENRNQQGVWLERADALVKKSPLATGDRVRVLVERAEHARSGLSPRDAMPLYNAALRLDPDHVDAIVGRAELLAGARLRETAIAGLELGLKRHPRSVALLRALAAHLASQDRTTEADAVAERYSQLRFDDASVIRERIQLAILQRRGADARRWIDRLLALDPDDSGSLGSAARSMLLLGDRMQAISLYKRSLELAPEDTDAMEQLADAYALSGDRQSQLGLLRKVLTLKPQAKAIRDYVALAAPSESRKDEKYAVPSKVFLAGRAEGSHGFAKRTLVDLTVSTVFENGLASRFHQVVMQPLTPAAAEHAREYAFGYEANSEVVQLRGARVYRKDGSVDEAVETGEQQANDPTIRMYTSSRVFFVRFPRLAPGDVIELRYRVEDVAARNAFADYFGEVTYLQSDEPIQHAEYVLVTPKSRTFYFNKPRVPGLSRRVEETKQERVYRFLAKNVPPKRAEPRQPPASEVMGHVHVSTYKSWDEMGKWYWGLVRDQFVADDEVRTRVKKITAGLKTDDEKVRAVYDYVVQNTRYVALEFGIHGFKPYRCAQIFARGFGDCKDKATLIVTMLGELGIPATIVIVRTQHKGDVETYPASLAPFDHAIAYVPSLDLYLDGTAEYTGSRELPAMDRNALALQVNQGKPKLVRLPDPAASASVTTQTWTVKVQGKAKASGHFKLSATGTNAGALRRFYHAESTRTQRMNEALSAHFSGTKVSNVKANDLTDVEAPVAIEADFANDALVQPDGDKYSVLAGPRDHLVRDFAERTTRKLDVRLGTKQKTVFSTTFELPKDATVTSLPQPGTQKSKFGEVRVEMKREENRVNVTTTISLHVSRVRVADYAAFKRWCQSADRLLGQRIVYALAGGSKTR